MPVCGYTEVREDVPRQRHVLGENVALEFDHIRPPFREALAVSRGVNTKRIPPVYGTGSARSLTYKVDSASPATGGSTDNLSPARR